jgi:lysyl-tRNA synthetase class 2
VSDNDLTAARRAKLQELRAQGNAYRNDFRPQDAAGGLQEAYATADAAALEASERRVSVAGRVMARRSFGQASFVVLQDASGRIQAYLRKDRLPADDFAHVKALDVGDLLGVTGTLFRTRTGELTIGAERCFPITKCLHPLPEKWHGLTDVETRYRQRYLDLIVNPEVVALFREKARIIAGVRRFLSDRGFVEVETPILQAIAGGAAARPFVTHHQTLGMELQLRIAPELFLKRLLVGGLERVFELGRNFRNEGISTQHNPEFTMLEFYQAYATYEDLMSLTEELVSGLARELRGDTRIEYAEHTLELAPPWRRLDLLDATAAAAGCTTADLRSAGTAARLAAEHGVALPPGGGAGAIATALFEHFVEPTLIQPTFVTRFPTEVSPLARPNEADPFLVDRFELYVAGRELANGFSELNDPDLQRERFQAQVESRRQGDEEAHPMDADYVTALEYGMPPAAGEGIGLERLVMILCGAPSIRDVVLFPLLRSGG